MKPSSESSIKEEIYTIVFQNDTFGGRLFDLILLVIILASVLVVILQSVVSLQPKYGDAFNVIEWVFTGLFTVEYLLRIYCSKDRKKYMLSFFGLIDLMAVLPNYIDLLVGGAHYIMVVRVLRLLRVFRILKLSRYLSEADVLKNALIASRPKIIVFLGSVLTAVIVIGALMYLVEGPENGFVNIPTSMYWAIVTLTTVGYGDVAPRTPWGQAIASFVMILGYGIIAVPTGIVSVELNEASKRSRQETVCPNCARAGHDKDAVHCKYCGISLTP